jgi:hypothetical protein
MRFAFFRAGIVAFFAVSGLAGSTATGQALGTVVDVVAQFATIDHNGDPLGFRLGVADDPYLWTDCPSPFGCYFKGCKHYQGLARANALGTPWFFLTRSGNETGSCSGGGFNPGELLVVSMQSRDHEGERIRSNRIFSTPTSTFPIPAEEDAGVAHLHFVFEPIGGPGWMHPGGVQIVDDVLVVPMQHYCSWFGGYTGETGSLECVGTHDSTAASLVLVDVGNPLSPEILHEIDLRALEGTSGTPPDAHENGYGAVAAIAEPAGGYLFALMDASKPVAFLRSTTTDLRDPLFDVEPAGFWDPTGAPGWSGFQTFNFVRDASGALYAIGGDNECRDPIGIFCGEPIYEGDDYLRLFSVVEQSAGSWNLTYIGQRNLIGDDPYQGNLKAAGGLYVSPTGQLIVYTGHHDRFLHSDGTHYVVMGEFRNIDVYLSAAGGSLTPDFEVADVDGDGYGETSCSGWAELYLNVSGWTGGTNPRESWVFDYRDRQLFAWNSLGTLNDKTSAMRWNLPPGQAMYVFEHFNFGGTRWGPYTGAGSVANVGGSMNDEITSIRFTPIADAGASSYVGDVSADIELHRANPCYVNDPVPGSNLFPVTIEWSMAAPGDACVPATPPPACTLSFPNSARPSVQCSEAGEYPIRLRVSDAYGSDDDCATIYAPEPAEMTLMSAGIISIVALAIANRRHSRRL